MPSYVYEMWDYLSPSTADYKSTALNIDPQRVMYETGSKNQVVHLGDDGSEEIITLGGSTSMFNVRLQWDVLKTTEASKLFNWWNSTALANGMARSFRWTHPLDGHTYTARFDSDLSRTLQPGWIFSVPEVRLKILGRAT